MCVDVMLKIKLKYWMIMVVSDYSVLSRRRLPFVVLYSLGVTALLIFSLEG